MMNCCHALSLFRASSDCGHRARHTDKTSRASRHTLISSWSGCLKVDSPVGLAAPPLGFSWALWISSLVACTNCRLPLLADHAIFCTDFTVLRSGDYTSGLYIDMEQMRFHYKN